MVLYDVVKYVLSQRENFKLLSLRSRFKLFWLPCLVLMTNLNYLFLGGWRTESSWGVIRVCIRWLPLNKNHGSTNLDLHPQHPKIGVLYREAKGMRVNILGASQVKVFLDPKGPKFPATEYL